MTHFDWLFCDETVPLKNGRSRGDEYGGTSGRDEHGGTNGRDEHGGTNDEDECGGTDDDYAKYGLYFFKSMPFDVAHAHALTKLVKFKRCHCHDDVSVIKGIGTRTRSRLRHQGIMTVHELVHKYSIVDGPIPMFVNNAIDFLQKCPMHCT